MTVLVRREGERLDDLAEIDVAPTGHAALSRAPQSCNRPDSGGWLMTRGARDNAAWPVGATSISARSSRRSPSRRTSTSSAAQGSGRLAVHQPPDRSRQHPGERGRVSDPLVIVAAVLHDTVEDTDTTPDELTARFGPRSAPSSPRSPTTSASPRTSASAAGRARPPRQLPCPAGQARRQDLHLRDLAGRPPATWIWRASAPTSTGAARRRRRARPPRRARSALRRRLPGPAVTAARRPCPGKRWRSIPRSRLDLIPDVRDGLTRVER